MDRIQTLLEQTLAQVHELRAAPESTYRLQFHAQFTFRDAAALAPYFGELGVSHCYASPYLKARPGSQHGYDIINHELLNPQIGTEEDYLAWVEALHSRGLGHILDMVPNHMGIVGNENPWWNDVLENGASSPFAGFFDIDWQSSSRPELRERVLLPILGKPYAQALESQELRLGYEAGALTLFYFEHRFPIAPGTYVQVLGHRSEELEKILDAQDTAFLEYQSILTAIRHLPGRSETDPAKVAERQREKEVIKRRLAALEESSHAVREFVRGNVAIFNGRPGDRHSFDLLDSLITAQAYRPAYWRVATDEINYRRFFDVNELAALSMERPEVFQATHDLVLRLLVARQVAGLRIDHPDGLYDPKQYLRRLQKHFFLACAKSIAVMLPEFQDSEWKDVEAALWERARLERPEEIRAPLYVVVEKILGRDETLPNEWPVDGTSGYDFLNMVNGLFVDAENAKKFTHLYHDWIGGHVSFAEAVYQKKFLILQVSLSSELHMLAHQLDRLAQKNRDSRDFTLNSLRHALREIIACFPVYRSYINGGPIRPEDRKHVLLAVRRARRRNPAISASIFDFVRDMLLLVYPESAIEEDRLEQRRFVGKFQQVTAPVMAKGVEDTAFYVYNRLLSLNEVGGDPDRFGVAPAALHRYNQERQAQWPRALSATSTHDTKRSEDVRARLNVLSEMPDEWRDHLVRWSQMNARHRVEVEETMVPGPNEEHFFYQTLVGAWPLEPCSGEVYGDFVDRIQSYVEKAIHEAKVHTSWINPDPAYDEAIHLFVGRVLDEENKDFLADLRGFQQPISHFGMFNSLAQTVLKIGSPGAADFYQGTELWDYSLVDPDNRRAVDYDIRKHDLRELRERAAGDRRGLARDLVRKKEDGRIKLYVTTEGLHCRKRNAGLFTAGEYIPLEARGAGQQHIFAFTRRLGSAQALIAVPRLLSSLTASALEPPLGKKAWKGTELLLATGKAARSWRNVFTGERLAVRRDCKELVVAASELFADFPVALLLAENQLLS
jgi:(1->4)-alpha-D-glucan 1-alpha-D-glucosylmutase